MLKRPEVTILLMFPLILVACSTSGARSGRFAGIPRCIDEKKLMTELIPSFERMIDDEARHSGESASKSASSSTKPPERPVALTTQVLEDKCWKKTLVRGSYKIIAFKKPDDPEQKFQTFTLRTQDSSDYRGDCLEESLKAVKGLQLEFADRILKQHREELSWLWEDEDIGPTKWLRCDGRPNPLYYESLGTMLHELTHDLERNSCLYDPQNAEDQCLRISEGLPGVRVARLGTFPSRNKDQIEALRQVERSFLTENDQSPLHLFAELNGQIVTIDIYSALIKKHGQSAIFDDRGRRPIVLLPLFLLYTARYLEEVRSRTPRVFARDFAQQTKNAQILRKMLERGEESYHGWLSALSFIDQESKDVEQQLWSQYLRLKRKLMDRS